MNGIRVLVWVVLTLCAIQVNAVEAWKQVVPKATRVTQGHLRYPSPYAAGYTHFGVDIDGNCGDDIFPLYDGEIINVARNTNGLGFAVMMKHPGRGRNGVLYTIYLHMQELPRRTTGWVPATESIGRVGATGATGGTCHTHFEIRNFYNPNAPGGGWYHEQSKSCSTGSLNIYACGDQRTVSWALSDWEDPQAFQLSLVPCNPSKERCTLRINGLIGWYPPVDDCQQASQWFELIRDTANKVSKIVPATKSACPLVCYAN